MPSTYIQYWNTPEIQGGNNCYNYSTNRRTDSFAQPGQASQQTYSSLTCASVLAAAQKDLGLARTRLFTSQANPSDTLIALVVAPGSDFHWYRRDQSGMWSHKPGGTEARTEDENGNPIFSPETAVRGMYTDFCGYFKIRNFVGVDHDQNGGYVRIGSMKTLPSLSTGGLPKRRPHHPVRSFVEVQMYSGRVNPRVLLSDLISNSSVSPALYNFKSDLELSEKARSVSPHLCLKAKKPGLGEVGLVIHDVEGLLFEKDAAIQVRPACVRDNTSLRALSAPSVVSDRLIEVVQQAAQNQ